MMHILGRGISNRRNMRFIYFLTCTLFQFSNIGVDSKKIVRLREFHSCPEYKNTVSTVLDCQIDMIGLGKTSISSNFEIQREVKDITKLIFRINKCPSFSEREKCELFLRMQYKEKVCRRLQEENQFWSEFVHSIQPEYKCPIKKGKYRVTNATFEPALFEALTYGIDQYYWQVYVSAMENKDMIFCTLYGGEIVRIKSDV